MRFKLKKMPDDHCKHIILYWAIELLSWPILTIRGPLVGLSIEMELSMKREMMEILGWIK
jgi:hypothetical protein